MRTTSTAARLLAAGVLATLGFAACGDDDDAGDADTPTTEAVSDPTPAPTAPATDAPATDAPTTDAPTTDAPATDGPTTAPASAPAIPGGTASDEFCSSFVAVEAAFREMPDDPAALADYAAERVTPNAEVLTANLPEGELGEQVGVMLSSFQEFLATGDFMAMQTPELAAASEAVYPALEEACGIPDVEITAVDFTYEGVPSTMDAGLTTFLLDNQSEAGELHEIALVKLRDDVDMPLTDILAMPQEESEALIDRFGGVVFAQPGAQGGSVVELTPGRWIYACFIPVGTIDGAEGTGAPHFVEGMAGEFTVA